MSEGRKEERKRDRPLGAQAGASFSLPWRWVGGDREGQ